MNKNYLLTDFEDTDTDDLSLLGSRFAHISAEMQDRKHHREIFDGDTAYDRAPKRKSFRPRAKSYRDREA